MKTSKNRCVVILSFIIGIKNAFAGIKNPYYNNEIKGLKEPVIDMCNPPHVIVSGDEADIGLKDAGFKLKGLIVMINHGDCGPKNAVKNMETINCSANTNDKQQTNFLNLLEKIPSFFFRLFKQPKVDLNKNTCTFNELTPVGVSQLLKLGNVLNSTYSSLIKQIRSKDITIYTATYLRTFYSAFALAYAIVPDANISEKCVRLEESNIDKFCFDYCDCDILDSWTNEINLSYYTCMQRMKATSLKDALDRLHNTLYADPTRVMNDPYILKDSIMAYTCHGQLLPKYQKEGVIEDDVIALLEFIKDDTTSYAQHELLQKYGMLKSYGWARHLASTLLYNICSNTNGLVIYSSHHLSLQHLLITFGGLDSRFMFPKYASRIVFEIYTNRDEKHKEPSTSTINRCNGNFFRIIFNGQDITKSVAFCKNSIIRSSPYYLCSVNSALKFINEDYFKLFNVQDFSAACINK